MEKKIYEVLPKSQISLDLKARTKEDVLKEMVDFLGSSPYVLDKNQLLDHLIEREKLETTGIGDGIALPHARTDSVDQLVIAFGRSTQGIEFDSLDGNPVYIAFLIAAPRSSSTKALKTLAKISRLLNNKKFIKALLSAQTKDEILDLLRSRE